MYVYLISKAQVQLYQYILSSEEERAQEEYLFAGPCWEEDSVLTYSGVGRVLQTDSQSGQLSSTRKPFLSKFAVGEEDDRAASGSDCDLDKDEGAGGEELERFYYSRDDGKCHKFVYKGEGGNSNR